MEIQTTENTMYFPTITLFWLDYQLRHGLVTLVLPQMLRFVPAMRCCEDTQRFP